MTAKDTDSKIASMEKRIAELERIVGRLEYERNDDLRRKTEGEMRARGQIR